MTEKIKIHTFNWGPCVTKFKIKPEFGKQLLDEPKVDSETFNVFRSVDNLFDNNVYKVSTTERPNIIKNQTTLIKK